MGTFKKALIICRFEVKKSKEQHRIIKEGFTYLVVSETNYKLKYKEHCKSSNSEMMLVFTRNFYDNSDLNFDTACIAAQNSSEKNGGTWHVVKINNIYFDVEQNFFIARPEVESLAKFENIIKFDSKKVFLNLNRRQRRELLKSK
jgi:hypothetical protein